LYGARSHRGWRRDDTDRMPPLRITSALSPPPAALTTEQQRGDGPVRMPRQRASDAYERELDNRRELRRVIGEGPVLGGPTTGVLAGLASPVTERGDVPDPHVRGVQGIDRHERPVRLTRLPVPAGFSRLLPRPEDVQQRELGDCWLLATLAAVANASPEYLRAHIEQVGPVTFRVFGELVDTDFPTVDGQPIFAQAAGPSLWVALVEKRFAQFRDRGAAPDYGSIEGGFEATAFMALGIAAHELCTAKLRRDEWTAQLYAAVLGGHPACVGVARDCVRDGVVLYGPHAYSVLRARVNDRGGVEFELRNPWGNDANSTSGDGRFWIAADALHDLADEATVGDVPRAPTP
jgi:hypothetical protein